MLFLDTGVLFDVIISKNQDSVKLLKEGTLLLNDAVFYEFGNLILARTKRIDLVYKSLTFILNNEKFKILPIAGADKDEALEMLQKYSDQSFSIVDSIILTQAKRLNFTILTIDKRMSVFADAKVKIVEPSFDN